MSSSVISAKNEFSSSRPFAESFLIASILEDVIRDSANRRLDESSFFAEITDEDIDSLFS